MNHTIYLSHGGGPLPILRKDLHQNMFEYYENYGNRVNPKAIVIFSAHYEAEEFKVIHDFDGLLYDYYGFPEEAYNIEYNPPKNHELGKKIIEILNKNGLQSSESKRGLDHGVFIPLKVMFPKENIPVVQVSLKRGLDEAEHIRLGEALSELDDVLFIGSGFSFHNLNSFFDQNKEVDKMNDAFHDALIDVLRDETSVKEKLINWRSLPYANIMHPRHEHLLPLHICYGLNNKPGTIGFDDFITGKRCICVEW